MVGDSQQNNGQEISEIRVSSVIFLDIINSYFQSINTDNTYEAPEFLNIPPGTHVATVDEYDVFNLLIHQK